MRALLVLLLLSLALPVRATWHVFGANNATAIDFRSPHQGVLALNDATHLIQTFEDGKLSGVFQSPDVVTGIVIQDSMMAWAIVRGNGLYIGTKHWSSWKQTTSQSNLTLVAATPSGVFLYSIGQLYFTHDGTNLSAVNGIPAGDSITAIEYLSDNIVFAASQSTVYRSTDAGQDWTTVVSGTKSCTSLFADRANGVVYAGGDTLRKSTDGVHWNIVNVPLPFSWAKVSGYVTGAHDCTGTFYVVADSFNFDYSIIRSTNEGRTFEKVGGYAPLVSPLRHAWTFDRGSTFWWWDWDMTKGVPNLAWSDDGLDGIITDSVASYISLTTNDIYDTACGASTPFVVQIASSSCIPIRIDTIYGTATKGAIGKLSIGKTLQGDSTSIALNYLPIQSGIDTVTLHVTLHSFEWKFSEHVDISAIAYVSAAPAKLGELHDLDFGDVRMDSVKTLALQIPNIGCNGLRVDSIVSTNPTIFAIDNLQLPLYVKGDSIAHIPVHFTPRSAGLALESLEIGTNVGHQFVTVRGNGVRVVEDVDQSSSRAIRLYPNPVSATLHATVRARIIIYDLLGREVIREEGDTFDLAALSEGEYFVRVNGRITPLTIARP